MSARPSRHTHVDGQYLAAHKGGSTASTSKGQPRKGRNRSASATPSTDRQPLDNLENQIPSGSQQPKKKRKKNHQREGSQPGQSGEDVETENERNAREREEMKARFAHMETTIASLKEDQRKKDEMCRKLQLEREELRGAQRRSEDDTGDEDEQEEIATGKKRRTLSPTERELRHKIHFFTYFFAVRLSYNEQNNIFGDGEDLTDREAEVYDGAVSIFGENLGEVDLAKLDKYMTQARSEARTRIKDVVLPVFDVSKSQLQDPDSDFRKNAGQLHALGWTFKDYPTCEVGLFQSDFLISCMSALLHGPNSINEDSAAARAAFSATKAKIWEPAKITRGFIAFTCSLVSNVLRGAKEFRMPVENKRNTTIEDYDRVLTLLDARPHDEPEILKYLTQALIPEVEEEEDEDNDKSDREMNQLLNPDFGAFQPSNDDNDDEE